MKGVGGKYLETGNEIQAKNTSCAEVYFKKKPTNSTVLKKLIVVEWKHFTQAAEGQVLRLSPARTASELWLCCGSSIGQMLLAAAGEALL